MAISPDWKKNKAISDTFRILKRGRPKSAKGQLGLKLASISTQDGVHKAKNASIATRVKACLPVYLAVYATYAYYFNQIEFLALAESH